METAGRQEALGDFSALIDEEVWAAYRPAIEALRERGIPFALGGGLAFCAYSERWRRLKDVDLFILPRDRDAAVEAIGRGGFRDYFDVKPYDREWIFRGHRGEHIIDLISKMANYRNEVEEEWFRGGGEILLYGTRLPLLPIEELVFSKLYIVQKDRCDWPDLLNIFHERASEMRWSRVRELVGADMALVSSLLSLFGWICPARAREIPTPVWEAFGVREPEEDHVCDCHERVPLLDSRDWFGPTSTESVQ